MALRSERKPKWFGDNSRRHSLMSALGFGSSPYPVHWEKITHGEDGSYSTIDDG